MLFMDGFVDASMHRNAHRGSMGFAQIDDGLSMHQLGVTSLVQPYSIFWTHAVFLANVIHTL